MSEKQKLDDSNVEESSMQGDCTTDDHSEFENLPPTYDSIFHPVELPATERSLERSSLAVLEDDGRLSVNLGTGPRTSAIVQAYSLPARPARIIEIQSRAGPHEHSQEITCESNGISIKVDIVFFLVGSKDEIKSCMLVAQGLRRQGHRVRVATHSMFESLAKSLDLDFFCINNNPSHQIADSGFIPALSSPDRNQIATNQQTLMTSLKSCWASCLYQGEWPEKPFLAEAIIATPQAHAHIHCAERLGIPLQLISTSPCTPTKDFPHPFARIQGMDQMEHGMQNYLSYLLIEESIWEEIYPVIYDFRRETLGLLDTPLDGGSRNLRRLGIHHTYLWSPNLIPRPQDWDENNYIAGLIVQDNEVSHNPSEGLDKFLRSGSPVIYVSLSAHLLKSPENFIQYLGMAANSNKQCFLLSHSFHSTPGATNFHNVFVLPDPVDERVLSKVSVVLSHGDLSTVSLCLRHGKPMATLPLVGDQYFWSNAMCQAGLSPNPIHEHDICAPYDVVFHAIQFCLQPDTQQTARDFADKVKNENGFVNALATLNHNIIVDIFTCSIIKSDPALYRLCSRPEVKLSAVAAEILMSSAIIEESNLERINHCNYITPLEVERKVLKVQNSYISGIKSAGKGYFQAVARPTVKHIADAIHRQGGSSGAEIVKTKANEERSNRGEALGLAKTVGFGSAVFLGKVAALPFKTVYYVGAAASIGVKGLKALDGHLSGTGDSQGLVDSQNSEPERPDAPNRPSQELQSKNKPDAQVLNHIHMLQRQRGQNDRRSFDSQFRDMVAFKFKDLMKQQP